MEIILNPEELIFCPYDSSHHIRRNKMSMHLLKCKKNHPDARIRTCDFNVTHQIPEPELQYHHEHCSSRKDVEITVYQEYGEEINKFPVHNISVETEESWDTFNSPSYDPKEYCEKNDVLRKLDVEPAAKKKDFHILERNRLRQITGDIKKVVNGIADVEKQVEVERTHEETVIQGILENSPVSNPISDLLERIKLGANTPFNSIRKK